MVLFLLHGKTFLGVVWFWIQRLEQHIDLKIEKPGKTQKAIDELNWIKNHFNKPCSKMLDEPDV